MFCHLFILWPQFCFMYLEVRNMRQNLDSVVMHAHSWPLYFVDKQPGGQETGLRQSHQRFNTGNDGLCTSTVCLYQSGLCLYSFLTVACLVFPFRLLLERTTNWYSKQQPPTNSCSHMKQRSMVLYSLTQTCR